MSMFGNRWKIGGLIAGPVSPHGSVNGSYSIIFERGNGASLEGIEAIDWACPSVKRLPAARDNEPGLPPGYGFELEGIDYHHGPGYFTVTVRTARQYLGDVTGYQAQIDALSADVAAKDGRIASLEDQLAEADEAAIALYEAMAGGKEIAV